VEITGADEKSSAPKLLAMNKSEFQQKISGSNKPIIIEFWATWCSPCMMTKPILEKLSKEYTNKVEFMPINADDSREVLEQYRVFGIPTVIAIRNGKEVRRVTGAQNESNYRDLFEAMSEGKEVKTSLAQFDRMLRLGTGALFVIVGITTQNWIIGGIGGMIAFMGIYDRCPIWRALRGILKHS
jgi:thioredoxin 1